MKGSLLRAASSFTRINKIVADDWGLPVRERADMKPGGLYDLVDALNVVQAENANKKTEQGD